MPLTTNNSSDVIVIGAGIAGIATAYYLAIDRTRPRVTLIDSRAPMSYTSAQSGDNYRNWWPHPTMVAFTSDSIDELERLAALSDNVFNMRRGGYVLVTRDDDINDRTAALGDATDVDVVSGSVDIQQRFPAVTAAAKHVIHIRRGGDIDGQQLGQYMLQAIRERGGKHVNGDVVAIDKSQRFQVSLRDKAKPLHADAIVNAAGPFAGDIAKMLGDKLPLTNVYQQKIAFEDELNAIPRTMPFTIDLDHQRLDWSCDERAMLQQDPALEWLAGATPSGVHCRPEGRSWLKLGWAYNTVHGEPVADLANEPAIDASFPEIVLRRAARLLPTLRCYADSPPSRISHYGGYYTMTDENWPLIGALSNAGAYIVGALSGFGSMAACAAGRLCAAHVTGGPLPAYAHDLSLARYNDTQLMDAITGDANRGVL